MKPVIYQYATRFFNVKLVFFKLVLYYSFSLCLTVSIEACIFLYEP